MKERLAYIDALKGFLIILIIWGHSATFNAEVGLYFTLCSVPAYFVVAGYTYNNTNIKLCEYIIKKAKRLLVPCFIYSSLGVLVCAILKNNMTIISEGMRGVLYSRFMLFPVNTEGENYYFLRYFNAPLWFLTAMFLSLIWAELFFRVKEKKLMFALLLMVSILCNRLPILLPWSLDTSFCGTILIILGYYYRKYEKAFPKGIFLVLLVIYVFLVYNNPEINMSVRTYGESGVVGFCLMGITGTLCYIKIFSIIGDKKCMKWLGYIGKKSITYIGTQLYFLTIPGWCGVIFAILGGTIIAYMCERLSTKIKILKYM